MNSQSPQSVV